MPTRPVYQCLAIAVAARIRCDNGFNPEWFDKWTDRIKGLIVDHFPSGSGFDAGCKFDFDNSTGNKLVIRTSFHHMNSGGFYDGWSDHTVTVIPDLQHGFDLKISGRDRNGIKDFIADAFNQALTVSLSWDA